MQLFEVRRKAEAEKIALRRLAKDRALQALAEAPPGFFNHAQSFTTPTPSRLREVLLGDHPDALTGAVLNKLAEGCRGFHQTLVNAVGTANFTFLQVSKLATMELPDLRHCLGSPSAAPSTTRASFDLYLRSITGMYAGSGGVGYVFGGASLSKRPPSPPPSPPPTSLDQCCLHLPPTHLFQARGRPTHGHYHAAAQFLHGLNILPQHQIESIRSFNDTMFSGDKCPAPFLPGTQLGYWSSYKWAPGDGRPGAAALSFNQASRMHQAAQEVAIAGGVPHIQQVTHSESFIKHQGVTRPRKESAEPLSIFNVTNSTFLVGGYALEDTEALENEALGDDDSAMDANAIEDPSSASGGSASASGSGTGTPADTEPVAGQNRKRGRGTG
jgi:hypothetical protein